MKTLLAVLTITCFTLALYSQNSPKEVQEMVFDTELIKNWKVGKTKLVNGHQVTKVQDGEDGWHRTNVLYRSANDVMEEVELRDDILVIMDDASQSWVLRSGAGLGVDKSDKLAAPVGGQLALFFDRSSAVAANMEHISIVLKSSYKGEELYRVEHIEDAPWKYEDNLWYNYKLINIPAYLGSEFFVEVYDHYLGTSYVFKVEQSPESINAWDLTRK